MYKITLTDIINKYDFDELIKVFLRPEQYDLFCQADTDDSDSKYDHILDFCGTEKNQLKREIYSTLSTLTGREPEWGIHTGVRPVKLVGEGLQALGTIEAVKNKLGDFYLFNQEKIDLLCDIYELQQKVAGQPETNSVGLYIGIPFCPTRCLYCSFPSNQASPEKIQAYMEALHKEIEFTGKKMKETGLYPESIYVGGGTPTALSAVQLDRLLDSINTSYDLTRLREFTVEAGRPDTITAEKLKAIAEHGVERISINPQSMKDETLKLIGRSHSCDDIYKAFDLARAAGIPIINTDIIAGLPEETVADFENTLDTMMRLEAENITVHTLAVKRASRLIDIDSSFHYRQADIVKNMLALAKERLHKMEYMPYYLYRQKHMAGSLENVGYAKEGCEGIYNIRIMEEHQTITALGAGGISKAYYPAENRLERVPNVSNFEIYIERLEEMLARKDENLFRR